MLLEGALPYNTAPVILMATGGASGGGYVCSQGLLYGIYVGLLVVHGIVNSFGGAPFVSICISAMVQFDHDSVCCCLHSSVLLQHSQTL